MALTYQISFIIILLVSVVKCAWHYGTPFRTYKDDLYSKMNQLQMYTGTAPNYHLEQFMNYAETFSSNVYRVEPKSLGEIQKVIMAARSAKCRIRVVGIGHSWSPLWADDGAILMDIRAVVAENGERFWVNHQSDDDTPTTVTVLGGVSVGDMVEYLVQNKLELPACSFSIFRNPTVAGIISTSSQSSSWTKAGASGCVIGVSIIDGTGKLRRFNAEEHPEEMRALRCCLGMCGVIYDVTFRAYSQRVYRVKSYLTTYGRLIEDRSQQRKIKTSVQPMGFGFTLNTMQADKTWDLYDDIINFRVVEEALPLGTPADPTDAILYMYFGRPSPTGEASYQATANYWQNTSEGRVYLPRAITPVIGGSKTDSGGLISALLFPETDDLHTLREVLQILREELSVASRTGTMSTSLMIGLRWSGRPDCYLCPQTGRDHNMMMDLYACPPTTPYQFQRFIYKLLKRYEPFGVRLHWGKLQLFQNYADHRRHLEQAYGLNLAAFVQTRAKAGFDPDDLFLNEYLSFIFGDFL